MSRRPDPLETRLAKGNPSGRKLPASAPGRLNFEPCPPEWLQGPALDLWNQMQTILAPRGRWTADSEMALTALCVAWGEHRALAEDIRVNGRFQTVRTKASGAPMQRARPALAALQDADRRLKAWLIEFGLTDAGKGKVAAALPKGNADGPLGRFGLN